MMHSGKALVSLCLSLCVLLPGLLVASLLDAIDSDQLTPEALLNDAGGSAGTETGGGRPPLRFKSDDTFRILQLTDLHYGESAALDLKSDEVQRAVLAAERPDLVVFSGDMVSGWHCKPSAPLLADCGPGWFAARWRQLIAPVHQAGIPYAITLGNHDAEAELSRRQIVDLDLRTGAPLSLTRQGPQQATGATNYHLDILGPAGARAARGGDGTEDPAARVWLLDSGERTCPPLMFGWGCVAEDTLQWLNATTQRLPPAPGLAFVHIPLPQFRNAWHDGPTVGSKLEDIACSVRDTGLLQLARQAGIGAIYSGHDHENDFVGSVKGVRLAYGRKSGWGSYGPPQGWLRGARVIELRLGQDMADSETWIRQEDGSQAAQRPSTQPKDLRQLICHCDDLAEAQQQHEWQSQQKNSQAADIVEL
ncbi:hypothetical protein D9Q98_005560 [Chlorella vulgaris]|uniref:Calcineurin-like phosphoesterase domain-containing protein n=1 Tax=Chlorella vulgaris TaxID=3077 RepID=A0A9D4TM59_CHLVU|nr:hypothetical protein D9Q98_005560 [Chlorella vulgaris]